MNQVVDWREFAGSNPEKFFKNTLWQGEHITIGLNCLEPNQSQKIHAHDGADKVYFVLEGSGTFTIGEDKKEAGPGSLVIAPSGVPHGVTNTTSERLSLLVAIAPGVAPGIK